MNTRQGITLIEILIAIAILAILAGIMIVAINPGQQFANSRNIQRWSDVNAILTAIHQNRSDNRGTFTCTGGTLPTSSQRMRSAGGYNIAPCLVPTYLPKLPFDPKTSGAHFTSVSDYDTGYFVARNASSGQITVSAPDAEGGDPVSATR